MTEIQKYLAEEVAEDLADGIITRREAMRRLGLMGLSASAASGLLASFTSAPAAAAPAHGGKGGAETTWAPVATRGDHVRRPERAADGCVGAAPRSRAAACS